MSPQEFLSQSILQCEPLMVRYLSGFNTLNHTRQAENLPNHAAWILGHCALTMHQVAHALDGRALPAGDFSDEPCRAATDDPAFCFYRESIAFRSTPIDDPAIYPSFERCVQIYKSACERLAAAVAGADSAQMQRTAAWGTEMPLRELVPRLVFHNGVHAGQLVDLRRALGMPPIF
jgi:hypothetical protein